MNKLRYRIRRFWLLVVACLLLGSSITNAVDQTAEAKLNVKLQGAVKHYDNEGKPLIPTLLKIAEVYHLPMGIEKVAKEAVNEPVEVKLEKGMVATLLDLVIRQRPGYSWTTKDGVVVVYGVEEFNKASNPLNQVVPSFSVKNETLDHANMRLRNILFIAPQSSAGAFAGSYIGTPQLEDKLISFSVRNATIRSILNHLAAAHGEVVWIARVTPEGLSQKPIPTAGLWRFLPRGIQDTQGIIDPR